MSSDILLTIWILAWDAHALFANTLSLFDANIFHPAPLSLAFSEHMLGAMPVYLPLSLLSGDVVFAHQAMLVLTFALAFVAMVALVWDWTRCLDAALVAGVLFAFSPFRVANLASIHIEGCYYLPLIVLFSRRVLDAGGGWSALLLFACIVLQTMHSYYLGYAAFLVIGVLGLVAGVTVEDRRRAFMWSLSVLGAVVVSAAASIPYVLARQGGTIEPPSAALVALGSARLWRTGATPAIAVALITLPFWRSGMWGGGQRRWIIALVALGVIGHAFALGPVVHLAGWAAPGPFALLQHFVPGFEAVRVPLRFNVATTLAASALAGVGLAGLRQSLLPETTTRWAIVGGLALSVLALWSSAPAVRTTDIAMTSQELATASWLSSRPVTPFIEIPFANVDLMTFQREPIAHSMYVSTRHWHQLLNGYSGYVPRSYRPVAALASALPDPRAIELLRRTTGLEHVVVHRDRLGLNERKRWRQLADDSGLHPRAIVGRDVIYAANRQTVADLLPGLIARESSPMTLMGTQRSMLEVSQQRGRIVVGGEVPRTSIRGIPFVLDVSVSNDSDVMWPALSPSREHLVGVSYRWEDETGRRIGGTDQPQQLPFDLSPRESVEMQIVVTPPAWSGRANLVVALAQDANWFPVIARPGSTTVREPGLKP